MSTDEQSYPIDEQSPSKEKLLPYVTLGQFLGVVELVEKGYINPTQFASRCIDIAKEYKANKGE